MDHKVLPDHLIYLTLHGSRAYGTETPQSDYDIRGVAIAPLKQYFGTRKWEQLQGSSPYLNGFLHKRFPEAPEDTDCEVFNIQKFLRLAADSNPNILDILFAHPDDWLYATPIWERIYEKRHSFLSMRVKFTYTGYAMSQLKRIETHRKWLLEPPKAKPSRAAFGLPEHKALIPKDIQDLAESMIQKKIQEWQLDSIREHLSEDEREEFKANLAGYFEMVHGRPFEQEGSHEREQAAIQVGIHKELYKKLDSERRYKQAMHHWKQYQGWLKNRNPARAKLEKEFGYDCKHASHLVRLLLSAEELLSTGDLSVRHPHAKLLREVRGGAWNYDELIAWANEQDAKIQELAKLKKLPKSPDREMLDQFATDLIFSFYGVSV